MFNESIDGGKMRLEMLIFGANQHIKGGNELLLELCAFIAFLVPFTPELRPPSALLTT